MTQHDALGEPGLEKRHGDPRPPTCSQSDMRQVGVHEFRQGGNAFEEGRHAAEDLDLLVEQQPQGTRRIEFIVDEIGNAHDHELDQLNGAAAGEQRRDID